MSQETAIFMVGVFTIIAAALLGLGTAVITAVISVLAFFLMVPTHHIRKLFGYGFTVDVAFGATIAMLAVGTLSGFQAAIVAGLISTLVRLELTKAWGASRLAVNGQTGIVGAIREIAQWTWAKLLRRADASITFEWVETTPAGGFAATNIGSMFGMLGARAGQPNGSWVPPALLAGAGFVAGAVMAPTVALAALAVGGVAATWVLLRGRTAASTPAALAA